jgi:hypothetical protein
MDDTEEVTLTMREIDRLRVIRDVLDDRIQQQEGAAQMGLSSRQVRRLCWRVATHGARGIRHGLRGKPGNHQLAPGLLERALELVAAHYRDFGPTFANEKLLERHGLDISTFALRQSMVAKGLWRPKRHKPFHRAWRPRRSCVGEMTQVDGSEHDWFEGRGPRCTLITFVDDATSKVLLGRFAKAEDTLTLMRLAQEYLRHYGRPQAYYVDKDSIYKINRQADLDEQLRDEQPMTSARTARKPKGAWNAASRPTNTGWSGSCVWPGYPAWRRAIASWARATWTATTPGSPSLRPMPRMLTASCCLSIVWIKSCLCAASGPFSTITRYASSTSSSKCSSTSR